MKKELQDLLAALAIAAAYFGATYFAVAALLPEQALNAALLAVIFSLLAYRFVGMEAGLPSGLLIMLPVVIVTAGVLWWILRLLGLWEIR